ncbi:TPA: hypothetical protein ACH3X1_003061 [Trebouxia sp. C0004]
MRAKNALLIDSLVIEKAKALAEKLHIEDFKASDGWLWRFKQCHNIKLQRPHGESGAADQQGIYQARLCRAHDPELDTLTQVEQDLTDDELVALVTEPAEAATADANDDVDCEWLKMLWQHHHWLMCAST